MKLYSLLKKYRKELNLVDKIKDLNYIIAKLQSEREDLEYMNNNLNKVISIQSKVIKEIEEIVTRNQYQNEKASIKRIKEIFFKNRIKI